MQKVGKFSIKGVKMSINLFFETKHNKRVIHEDFPWQTSSELTLAVLEVLDENN